MRSLMHIFKNYNKELFTFIKEVRLADAGKIIVVKLRGDIDSCTIPLIMEHWGEDFLKKFTNRNILCDLAEVRHIDSSTLAFLMLVLRNLKANGKKIGFINMSSLIKEYTNITRLNCCVCEYADEEAALEDMEIN